MKLNFQVESIDQSLLKLLETKIVFKIQNFCRLFFIVIFKEKVWSFAG